MTRRSTRAGISTSSRPRAGTPPPGPLRTPASGLTFLCTGLGTFVILIVGCAEMAGIGPPPKPYGSAARHRWAKPKATAAVLHTPEPGEVELPPLPAWRPGTGEWHRLRTACWRDVWASPMAPEYDNSDRHGLFALAVIVIDF